MRKISLVGLGIIFAIVTPASAETGCALFLKPAIETRGDGDNGISTTRLNHYAQDSRVCHGQIMFRCTPSGWMQDGPCDPDGVDAERRACLLEGETCSSPPGNQASGGSNDGSFQSPVQKDPPAPLDVGRQLDALFAPLHQGFSSNGTDQGGTTAPDGSDAMMLPVPPAGTDWTKGPPKPKPKLNGTGVANAGAGTPKRTESSNGQSTARRSGNNGGIPAGCSSQQRALEAEVRRISAQASSMGICAASRVAAGIYAKAAALNRRCIPGPEGQAQASEYESAAQQARQSAAQACM
ncbi:hypothetical protein [Mesorhizobium helmanticense]|uniref:hypothetical protein n=1 Tax=Mesorhizobium helmanticense TaxID=1776423 RepID=UPI0011B22750|nr:hypothetical protein [Mesorhizobium helmanticense]